MLSYLMPSGNILVTDKKAFYLFESKIDLPGKVLVLFFFFVFFLESQGSLG